MGGVIGKKCWKATFSYGGELCLHMGARVSYESPAMAGEKKGSWVFGTRGTAWRLIADTGRRISSEQGEDALDKKVRVLEDSTVSPPCPIGFPSWASSRGAIIVRGAGGFQWRFGAGNRPLHSGNARRV
jgi:hypothetical protein